MTVQAGTKVSQKPPVVLALGYVTTLSGTKVPVTRDPNTGSIRRVSDGRTIVSPGAIRSFTAYA